MHDLFEERRQQLRREREQRVTDLIAHAAQRTYQKLAEQKPCPCGKTVCIFRGDDWPRDAA